MRSKWLAIWTRLTPLWMSLWLISSLASPSIAWQHDDGSFCVPCSSHQIVLPVDDCCADELAPQVQVSQSHVDASCRQCCEPQEKHHHGYFFSRGVVPAVIGTPFRISLPVQQEVAVSFQTTTAKLVSLPRPPPLGRGPPFVFSVQPISIENTNGK